MLLAPSWEAFNEDKLGALRASSKGRQTRSFLPPCKIASCGPVYTHSECKCYFLCYPPGPPRTSGSEVKNPWFINYLDTSDEIPEVILTIAVIGADDFFQSFPQSHQANFGMVPWDDPRLKKKSWWMDPSRQNARCSSNFIGNTSKPYF